MLPTDIDMLVSFINMKLRDTYSSLEGLCDSEDVDLEDLLAKLKTAGYSYNRENNCIK